MNTTNVILTAYSCSSLAPCQEWAKKYFKNPPLVLSIPGTSGSAFRAKIIQWSKSGDVFSSAISELSPKNKNIKIGYRGLVTFSVGWVIADELLKIEKEKQKLNAYIALDGIHTENLKHFSDYATLAANTDAWMVCAHSSIKPPFIAASETNRKIYEAACHNNDNDNERPCLTSDPPDYVIKPEWTKPVKISVGAAGNLPATTKTWNKDPLLWWNNRGNLTRLHYDGNDRPDHVLIAQVIQERLWRWLGQVWNGEL